MNRRWQTYIDIQKQVQEEIAQAYDSYLNGLFEEEYTGKTSKNFWKTIKARRMDRVGVPSLRREDGSLETSSRGKACLLNDQYSSVFSDGDGSIPDLGPSPYNPMPPIVISSNGVRKLLSGQTQIELLALISCPLDS